MSTSIMSACWSLQMPPTQKAVLVSLADNANDQGECWPSIDTIGKRTCLHRASVIRAIAALEALGHVVADRSNGRRTRYLIKPNLDLFGAAKPVAQRNQSQKATGSTQRLDQSQSATKPVAQSDTNRKEPSRTKEQEQKITNPAGLVVPGKPGMPSCPQSEIVALYHELLPSLTRVKEWTPERQAFLRKRWNESSERQNLDWWRGFFGYVAASDFLTGKTTGRDGRSFECDLEWLVRPKNFVKVIEGKYENREVGP
jgi:hypothetical protein